MEIDDHNLPEADGAPLPDFPQPEPRRKKFTPVKILRLLGYALAAVIALNLLTIIGLRWIPPLTTSFMLRTAFTNSGKEKGDIRYKWTSWKKISPNLALAIVAAEDQKFPKHHGFDLESIAQAREENKSRRRPRGASTITQQVAKNLFLWSGRSYFRKGLEAAYTVLLELLWSKKRILEVYMNVAEFGPNIFGVGAAAEAYWHKKPANLTPYEAALLAAVLPNPKRLHADRPSAYVRERAAWIEQNMRQLGSGYLRDID